MKSVPSHERRGESKKADLAVGIVYGLRYAYSFVSGRSPFSHQLL